MEKKSDTSCIGNLMDKGVIFSLVTDVPEYDQAKNCYMLSGFLISKGVRKYEASYNHIFEFIGSCKMVEALLEFEKNDIQSLSVKHFGQKIKKIEHSGGYYCRTQPGNKMLSEHSYGLAIDISGFVLDDGEKIIVSDYLNPNAKGQLFLHKFAQRACKKFGTIVTPKTNILHQEYFHISMGLFGRCDL